jgi:hypothetical protein
VDVSTEFDCVDTACFDFVVPTEEPREEVDWQVYPNPTTGELTLYFSGKSFPESELFVLDLWGRTALTEPLVPGEREHSFTLAALPAGVYFVKLKADGEVVWMAKVVKQ